MKVLHIRGEFSDNGPGSQTVTIATELRARGHEVLFCSSGGHLTKKIKDLGFQYYLIPEMSYEKRGVVNVIKTIFAIRRILRKEKVDVLHGHNAAVILMVNLASLFLEKKVNCFQSVRGVETRQSHFFRNWIYRVISFKALFAVSEFTKKRLVSFGVPAEKILVTYNGTDLKRFEIKNKDSYRTSIREELDIPEDAIVIGIIGRQDGYKGHKDLVRVFSELHQCYESLYVILVGEGAELESNRQLAKDLNVDDRAIFTGLRIDVERLHAAFDIFTLLSKKGFEMFPNVIVEAMTYEIPFLSVNTTGVPEMAENDEGIICECADLDCYRESLKRLIEDPDLRAKMGANGRRSVVGKFNINQVVNKIENAYESYC